MKSKIQHGIIALGLGLVVAGCAAGAMPMGTNPEIPGAMGVAKLHRTNDGNTRITLTVKHLPPAEKVTPASATYVVWTQGLESGAQPQNMGALRVNGNYTGTMDAVTPLQSFELFITAEPAQTASYPTGNHLLPLHYAGK